MQLNYKYFLNSIFKNSFSKKQNLLQKGILPFFMFLLIATNIQAQTTFTSVQSGLFTDPTTWGTTTTPTSTDNVIIATGTTVVLDNVLTVNNATITGILEGSLNTSNFTITGNLIVNSGGLLKGSLLF